MEFNQCESGTQIAMNGIDEPEERYKSMPKDDASSIEILSEGGRPDWSICSASRGSIAGSDVGSMDFQKVSIHSKMATIVHQDGRQFIERRDLEDGGLPYSAEFYVGDELWKLNGEDCFLISPRRYIANVSMEGTVDLEEAASFEEALKMLLKQLKVVNVLLDEQLEECNKARRALEIMLDRLKDDLSAGIDQERDVIVLRMLFKEHGNALDENFKNSLINCLDLSSEIESALDSYVTKVYTMFKRDAALDQLNDSLLSFEFIDDAIQEASNAHRARLTAICPSILMEKLKQLPDDRILYVSSNDMNLFSDLESLNYITFEASLPIIFAKFLARVQEINEEQIVDFNPQPNHIFLYVCKSMQEVAEQLGVATKTENPIIYSKDLGWKVTNLQGESQTPYSKSLKQQLTMLAAFANHFEPGGSFRNNCFPYEFKLFNDLDAIPESVRIWLCLLDHCMTSLVQADYDKMKMLSCFFRSFVSFIASEDFQGETLDCLRTITHDVLRSLAGMQSSVQPKKITSDTVSLKRSDDISCCLDEFPRQHFGDECDQIEATLRRILIQDLSVESTACCDASNQLLKNLADLTLEWFIKLPPSENRNLLIQGQFIIAVDSIWKDTEYQCFKVVDPEAFVKMYKVLYKGDEIPKHYQLEVIQVLLDQLATTQIAENETSDARIDMINSIRKPIRLLKEQPEYSCFELFLKRMSESFSQSNKKKSMVDFRNEMSPTIQSPATDPAQTDPVDADESLDPLFNVFEGSVSKGFLVNGLQKFKTQFDKFLAESDHLPRESRIERIVSDVVLNVKPQLATAWTEEFKRNELPKVLAGLSAVWSLIVSQNGSSLEKLMKPSSMQIGCVLSLFGDQILNDDDWYRLLYISAQQGKELVLGLTAALLALYGHTVQIACYNSNLARRNVHLIELFKSFSIHYSISFGSVEDIARERSSEVYYNFAACIHYCIGEPYSSPKNPSNDGRSVLLIDDIDILLQCRTLGQTFKRYVRPTIPGLDFVQEKLFSMEDCDNQFKSSQLKSFIRNSRNPQLGRFRDFLADTQEYTLHKGNRFNRPKYRNKILFNKFRSQYLTGPSKIDLSHNFRLSSDGVLVVKNYDEYDEQDQHYICLEYLKLKGSDFQKTVNGYKNYGYMSFGCIAYPYARMLKSFPLVLGFASAPLDGYEDITLRDHYSIHHQIAKRNPLPMAPTEFDSMKHFLCVDSNYEWDWMMSIMVAINAAIGRNRSVLVFFKSEVEMEQFQSDFALHLKHLCVTTIETASNGENRTEDEIAVDEVTVLAIDPVDHDNGRLEENREVHIIQTFWSNDGKEEDLIRRQAERSHGGGSYELILLKNQLPVPEPIRKGQVSYDLLDGLREKRCYGKAMFNLNFHEECYEDLASIFNN